MIPVSFAVPSKILVIGAGGGYDFLCGLPIVLELEALGHQVFIGNYSFTDLSKVNNAEWNTNSLLKITADSHLSSGDYFPEVFLSKWYRELHNIEKPIWCLDRKGVVPTLEAYNFLVQNLGIDVVICVDGGVDGIFRGDEYELGTPSMDSISIIATSLCSAKKRIYVCSAFGIDGAESGLSHAQALNRIADLIKQNAALGIDMVLNNAPAGIRFRDAVNFIFQHVKPIQRSTIVSCILASMDGSCGRTAVNLKTEEGKPWISPLTSLYWYFEAENVAKMKLFYTSALTSQTVQEVGSSIEKVRLEFGVQPHESIPI